MLVLVSINTSVVRLIILISMLILINTSLLRMKSVLLLALVISMLVLVLIDSNVMGLIKSIPMLRLILIHASVKTSRRCICIYFSLYTVYCCVRICVLYYSGTLIDVPAAAVFQTLSLCKVPLTAFAAASFHRNKVVQPSSVLPPFWHFNLVNYAGRQRAVGPDSVAVAR